MASGNRWAFLSRLRDRVRQPRQQAAAPPHSPPPRTDRPAPPPLQTPLETIRVWSDYAKDRFESEASRIVDFRNWARQLAAAVAVVIAFEVNAIVQLAIRGPEGDWIVWATRALVFLLLGVALRWQAKALTDALRVGYRGDVLTGPESPAKLGEFILGKDEWEASRLVGAYYAKAYDEFCQLAENLSQQVATASREFRKSLLVLFLGLILLVLGLFGSRGGDIFRAMSQGHSPADRPGQVTPPVTVPGSPTSQPPSAKSTAPLMETPTPGQPTTHGQHGGQTREKP